MGEWGVGNEQGLRKGPWTPEEDKLLTDYINLHGDGRWTSVAKFSGLKRNGKSCRLRWVNYLRPGLKKGQLTPQEEGIIIELHAIWGNKWSTIARYLPGRTDNEIKNFWRTHFKIKSKPSQRQEKRKAEALRHKKHLDDQTTTIQNIDSTSSNIICTTTNIVHHHTTNEHTSEVNNRDLTELQGNINEDIRFAYNASAMQSHQLSPLITYQDNLVSPWTETTVIGDDLWGSLWNLGDPHY